MDDGHLTAMIKKDTTKKFLISLVHIQLEL